MIDHIGLHVRDVARATELYLKALRPLGYGIVMQVSAGVALPAVNRSTRLPAGS